MDIKLEHIYVNLEGVLILKDIDVTLNTHEITMLIGLNGSGKTTLLKSLLGLYELTAGKVYYGEDVLKTLSIKSRSRQVGYVPQVLNTTINYTVSDFILMGSSPYLSWFQGPSLSQKKAVENLLKIYGLIHLKDRQMQSLSGGERQLIYFLQTQIQGCQYMVMDEPTAMLDYVRQYEFFKILNLVLKESKQGVLMSVHDPNLVLTYAKRVLVIEEGRIVGDFHKDSNQFNLELHECLKKVYGEALKFATVEGKDICLWEDKHEY